MKTTSTHGVASVHATRHAVVPAARLWEVISRPGGLPSYHAFVADNPVAEWPGPNSQDSIRYHSGLVLHRQFREWTDGSGYRLDIGSGDRHHAEVEWEVRPLGPWTSALRVTIRPYLDVMASGLPTRLRPPAWATAISPHLRRYLRVVVRGAVAFGESGEVVRRNEFGAQPFFSPRQLGGQDLPAPSAWFLHTARRRSR